MTRFEEVIQSNAALIEAIELTEDEIKAAILEGKRKKYFKLKHEDYWKEQEYKPKKDKPK